MYVLFIAGMLDTELTASKFYTLLDIKQAILKDVLLSRSLITVLKKLNLIQQNQTHINKPKNIIV